MNHYGICYKILMFKKKRYKKLLKHLKDSKTIFFCLKSFIVKFISLVPVCLEKYIILKIKNIYTTLLYIVPQIFLLSTTIF